MGGVTVRRSADRGQTTFDWLDSRHTFSFGDYHDPEHRGFRTLRVINEDVIRGGGAFAEHPHRDMEIFSYLLAGRLAHADSMGNRRVLAPGEIQLMSAGRGVTHSEANPDPGTAAHLLQIWIFPDARGYAPRYTEWRPDPKRADAAKTLVISPDGREGSAVIRQDANVWRLKLAAGRSVTHDLGAGRGLWLQVMRGSVALNGTSLAAGDGASLETAGAAEIRATADAEALLFDLA